MLNYNLRKYIEEDYDYIYQLKKELYITYIEDIWGTWNDDEQRKRFKTSMEKFKNNTYIIEIDGNKVGFYQGLIIDETNYEICNICIAKDYQNKGIGTELLKEIIEKYKNYNIHIQYFKQNRVGELYKKLGFVLNGETDTHYKMIKKGCDNT